MTVTLEHIDPRDGELVCGLLNPRNEILAGLSYNSRKTNRFVPYRIRDYPAPQTFGDIGEFCINGQWVVCEFGGPAWWDESNRIGNSCVNGGRTQGRRCVDFGIGMFNPEYLQSPKYFEDRKEIGQRRVSEKSGIFDPNYLASEKCREDKSRAGSKASREDKVRAGKLAGAATAEIVSKPILVIMPDGSQFQFRSSVQAGEELGLNGLTLRRLASEKRVGVKGKYKGLQAKFIN
jgi:hypothetical protein